MNTHYEEEVEEEICTKTFVGTQMCTNVYPCENEKNENDGYLPNQGKGRKKNHTNQIFICT